MKNLNFPVLGAGILAIAGSVEIGLIALNAEFLLAVCFVVFIVYFYTNLSGALVDPLDEQANTIQKEFEQYYDKYESMLNTLITYHRRRISLTDELKQIASFSKDELSYLVSKRQKAFAQEISDEINQKLKTIEIKEQGIYRDIQDQASSYFTDKVLLAFAKGKESNYSKDILVQEAVNSIEKVSTSKPENYALSKKLQDLLKPYLLINSVANIPLSFLILNAAKNNN